MNTDAMDCDRHEDAGTQDPTDFSAGTNTAGRVWHPTSVDELEGALSKAAVDSGIVIGGQWERFCKAVAKYLRVQDAER